MPIDDLKYPHDFLEKAHDKSSSHNPKYYQKIYVPAFVANKPFCLAILLNGSDGGKQSFEPSSE